MVPGTRPTIKDIRSTSFPALIAARGVAPDILSKPSFAEEKLFINPAKEIKRKHLAARAGFIKFCPSPPYSCFTTIIAKIPPRNGIHTGISGGMLRARIIPVTTALPSLTVIGFFISFSYTYSDSTQETTVAISTRSACIPNCHTP